MSRKDFNLDKRKICEKTITGSFRGDCDIRVWLCQIAKNCYYNYLKKAGQVDSIEAVELLNISAQDETVEERLSRQDEAMQIQKILHDVPDPYKEEMFVRTA